MSNSSGLIKSNIAKKYWMALTGLFLCTFLVAHLAGNLQLLLSGYEGRLQFAEYAAFMTTNPVVKILSYVTYFSILFHAVDGIVITVKNRKARPERYAYNKPGKNSLWSSRNMGVLGTIILAYIVVHMQNFWYKFKYSTDTLPFMTAQNSDAPLLKSTGEAIEGGIVEGEKVFLGNEYVGEVMRDLYTLCADAFQSEILVSFYVLGMAAIAFHLFHGFKSGFQSLGVNHPKYSPFIKKFGYAFAIVIPVAFAVIPVYMYFAH